MNKNGPLSYSTTFKELNNLAYNNKKKELDLNINTLRTFFLTTLNPSYILKRYLENILNQSPYISPYEHEISTKVLDKIWKTKIIKKNIVIFLYKFCSVLASFSAPIMLDALTNLFKNTDQQHQSLDFLSITIEMSQKNLGWIFCGILVLNNLLSLFFETQYNFHINKLRYECKTILQYFIFNKVIKLPNLASTSKASSKETEEEVNINNLATVDSETIVGLFLNFHQTWSSFLSLCVIVVILYFKLRSALPVGLILVLFLVWLASYLAKSIGKMYQEVMKAKDKRIDLTTDVLKGIKAIKYFGWEETFIRKILSLRQQEFSCLSKIKYLDVFCLILWTITSVLIVTATFIAFSYMKHDIHQTNVFTVIAYFQMLINPLNSLPWTIGSIFQGFASFKRLKKFLDSNISVKKEKAELQSETNTSDSEKIAVSLKFQRMTWPLSNKGQIVSDFSLKEIDLDIKKGTINIIIGSMGSGKSALLLAMLGEMSFNVNPQALKSSQGRQVNGTIAYVPQNPWLQRQTIKENILFGKHWDEELYKECVQVCDLDQDIASLPGKDNYDVGPDGLKLSGGQRQRISLCRALYQDADIYLLDDIFSSVDVNVANILFQGVILNFLKKRGKTIIMVLSQYKYLTQFSNVFLMYDGYLTKDNNKILNYLKEYHDQNQNKHEQTHLTNGQKEKDTIKFKETLVSKPIYEGEKTTQEKNLIEAGPEEKEKGEIQSKSVQLYLKSMGYFTFLSIFVTAIIMQASRAYYDFWLKNYLHASDPRKRPSFFIHSFETTLLALTLLCFVTTSLRAFVFAYGNLHAARNLFQTLVSKVIYSNMTFFDKNPLGRILQRFSGDTFSLDDGVPFNWNMLLNNIVIFVGSLYTIITQLPLMIFIICPILLIFYVLQKNFRKTSREIKRLDSFYTGSLFTHLSETTDGLKVIRAFKKERFIIDTFLEKIKHTLITKSLLETINLWLTIRIRALSSVMLAVLLCLAMYYKFYVISGFDFNDFALALMYAIANPVNFEDIIGSFTAVEREFIGVERIGQYLENETEQESQERETSTKKPFEPQYKNNENESVISFKNVSLSFWNETSQGKKFAIQNISFEVKKGQKIALCGRTGSGKTTILNCLLKLYEISSGQIKLFGLDINELSKKKIRSSIAVIPQFGFMYEGTLRDNLDPEKAKSLEAINEILQKSHVLLKRAKKEQKTENEIKENKQNILDENFLIEKNGTNLSNGEKQIINFLRAMLMDRSIVFLDEATSNLDPATDAMLQKSIFEFCKEKTLITITHRLEYLQYYDKIIVLDEGKIVEVGKYEDLMNKSEGKLKTFMTENYSIS